MKESVRRNLQVATFVGAMVVLAQSAAQAQEPVRNVDPYRHGNIAAAQALTRQAFDKMTAAQQANEFDMGGHAARAKELLQQAAEEMKQAAMAANRR